MRKILVIFLLFFIEGIISEAQDNQTDFLDFSEVNETMLENYKRKMGIRRRRHMQKPFLNDTSIDPYSSDRKDLDIPKPSLNRTQKYLDSKHQRSQGCKHSQYHSTQRDKHSNCTHKTKSRKMSRFIYFLRRSLIAKIIYILLCVGVLALGVWIFVKFYNKRNARKQNELYERLNQLIKNGDRQNPEVIVNDLSNVAGDDFQVINYDNVSNESNVSPIPEQYYYQQAN